MNVLDGVIQVGAIDDHPAVLRGLQEHLTRDTTLTFAGGAGTVASFIETHDRPDVVLLDLQLEDRSHPRANVAALVEWGATVLIYSDGLHHARMTEALTAGAGGVVLKDRPLADLVPAIRAAARGEVYLETDVALALRAASLLRPVLAPREVEVLVLAAQGVLYKQIATQLGISDETVKTHLKRIRVKYSDLDRDATTRIALRGVAEEDGYVEAWRP